MTIVHRRDGPGCIPSSKAILGLLVGDGVLKKDKAVLSVWSTAGEGCRGVMQEAARCASTLPHRSDFAGWTQPIPVRHESRMGLASLRDLALECGMAPGSKIITPFLEQGSSECYPGFL